MPSPDTAAQEEGRALADRLAERIAAFRRSDYDEGCYPSFACTAAEWETILAALRSTPDPARCADRSGAGGAEGMRAACLAVIEAHTYKGQGTEGRNDLIGMFARGQMRCKQALAKKVRALSTTPGTGPSEEDRWP